MGEEIDMLMAPDSFGFSTSRYVGCSVDCDQYCYCENICIHCSQENAECVCQRHNQFSNPWKRLISERVYKNPWIIVNEDKVIKPSGDNGIYGVVNLKNKALGVIDRG